MDGRHPADRPDYMTPNDWYVIQCMRRDEGRCHKCGVFDGPDHRCPSRKHDNMKATPVPSPVRRPSMPACCVASGVGVCDYHAANPMKEIN